MAHSASGKGQAAHWQIGREQKREELIRQSLGQGAERGTDEAGEGYQSGTQGEFGANLWYTFQNASEILKVGQSGSLETIKNVGATPM